MLWVQQVSGKSGSFGSWLGSMDVRLECQRVAVLSTIDLKKPDERDERVSTEFRHCWVPLPRHVFLQARDVVPGGEDGF